VQTANNVCLQGSPAQKSSGEYVTKVKGVVLRRQQNNYIQTIEDKSRRSDGETKPCSEKVQVRKIKSGQENIKKEQIFNLTPKNESPKRQIQSATLRPIPHKDTNISRACGVQPKNGASQCVIKKLQEAHGVSVCYFRFATDYSW
jgi:hypothetical protein